MHGSSDTPFRSLVPWVCFVALMYFLTCVGRTVAGPVLPLIEEELQISHVLATSIMLWLAIGFSIGMFLSGFVLGYLRPRWQVGLSLLVGGCFLVLVPLTTSLWPLRLLFACFGLCAGMYVTAGMATMHSFVTYANWGKAISIHQLAPHLAFILTPLLANLFLKFMSWRASLALVGVLCIAAGALFGLFAKGGREPLERMSFKGFAGILATPSALIIMCFMIMGMSGEFAVFNVLPLYLTCELKLDLETANTILSATRLLAPLCVLAGGILADILSARTIIKVLFVAHGLSLWVISARILPVAVTGIVLQGMIVAVYASSIFKVLAQTFPPERQPIVLAAVMPFGAMIALGVIPNLFGWAGDIASFAAAFRVYGLFSVALPLLFFFLPGPAPGEHRPA